MQQPLNNSVCYLLKTIYLNYVYHLLKQSFSLLAKVLPLKKTNQWFFIKKCHCMQIHHIKNSFPIYIKHQLSLSLQKN